MKFLTELAQVIQTGAIMGFAIVALMVAYGGIEQQVYYHYHAGVDISIEELEAAIDAADPGDTVVIGTDGKIMMEKVKP